MLEFKINLLRLNFQGVSGQEHRLENIAERALSLLADQLSASRDGMIAADVENMGPLDVRIDLDRMSDEQSADQLAQAMREAIQVQAGY